MISYEFPILELVFKTQTSCVYTHSKILYLKHQIIMKKLSVGKLKLQASDVLNRDELKEISGGDEIIGRGNCTVVCRNGSTITANNCDGAADTMCWLVGVSFCLCGPYDV